MTRTTANALGGDWSELEEACQSGAIGRAIIQLCNLNGEPADLEVETLSNSYLVFAMLQPSRRLSLGRRIVLSALMSVLESRRRRQR